jgi:hypothetical protein
MLCVAGAVVRLNIGVVEKNLVIVDAGEGVVEIRETGANRFDLRSLEFNAGLNPFKDLIVVECAAVGNDLVGHMGKRIGVSAYRRLKRASSNALVTITMSQSYFQYADTQKRRCADTFPQAGDRTLNFVGWRVLKFKCQLAINNFFQCNIGIGHARSNFNERPMTHGQLPNALGHKIHQQSGVWNDFGRFLKKLAGHTVGLP